MTALIMSVCVCAVNIRRALFRSMTVKIEKGRPIGRSATCPQQQLHTGAVAAQGPRKLNMSHFSTYSILGID